MIAAACNQTTAQTLRTATAIVSEVAAGFYHPKIDHLFHDMVSSHG